MITYPFTPSCRNPLLQVGNRNIYTFGNDICCPAPHRAAMRRCIYLSLITTAILIIANSVYAAEGSEQGHNVLEERNRLVDSVRTDGADALPELQAAVSSDNEVIRRTAAHLLAHVGKPAQDILVRNLAHDDAEVRYIVGGALQKLGVAGEHVIELVTDADARIRRRFYQNIMPEHLLDNGAPPDDLIALFDSGYDVGSEMARYDIIQVVAELPLTESSIALVRRAVDLEKAVVAAKGSKSKFGLVEKTSLIAFRVLQDHAIEKMRKLAGTGKWSKLVEVLEGLNIRSWPATRALGRKIPGGAYANERAEATYLIAKAYHELGQGEQAEQTLRILIEEMDLRIGHKNERRFYIQILDLYKQNYQANLREQNEVRDRYVQMEFDYGNRLVAAGREDEARESYERILKVQANDPSLSSDSPHPGAPK